MKLGKYGIFRSEHLLGHPFGLSYEVAEKKALKVVPHKAFEGIGMFKCYRFVAHGKSETLTPPEETNATNELINDDGRFVQPLTSEEIEALKSSGAHVTVSVLLLALFSLSLPLRRKLSSVKSRLIQTMNSKTNTAKKSIRRGKKPSESSNRTRYEQENRCELDSPKDSPLSNRLYSTSANIISYGIPVKSGIFVLMH